jgi:hypothetical protein
MNFATIQPYLAIVLPLIMPYGGSLLASVLQQDGFDRYSPLINDSLAWSFLILASAGSAWVDNQLLATPNLAINAVVGTATLLLAGPLTSLKPWVSFKGMLAANLFNVVPLPAPSLEVSAQSKTSNAASPIPPRASAQKPNNTAG